MGRAELTDLFDGSFGIADDAQSVGQAAELDERGNLGPVGEDKTAVATRRAAAADVLFEDDDGTGRFEALDVDRSPKAT